MGAYLVNVDAEFMDWAAQVEFIDPLELAEEGQEEGAEFAFTVDDLDPYLDRLPPEEADILKMICSGSRQADIARLMEMTQAGVSYRARRAIDRVRYMLWLDGVLGRDEEKIRSDLSALMADYPYFDPSRMTDAQRVEILIHIWRTSCGSETDEVLGLRSGASRCMFLAFAKIARRNKDPQFDRYREWVKGHRWSILHDTPSGGKRRVGTRKLPEPWTLAGSIRELCERAITIIEASPGIGGSALRDRLGLDPLKFMKVSQRLYKGRHIRREGQARNFTYWPLG